MPVQEEKNCYRGKIIPKVNQGESQRLNFLVVILFLAIFGLIVLAEVILMEEFASGTRNDIFYEDDAIKGLGNHLLEVSWETPRPISPNVA